MPEGNNTVWQLNVPWQRSRAWQVLPTLLATVLSNSLPSLQPHCLHPISSHHRLSSRWLAQSSNGLPGSTLTLDGLLSQLPHVCPFKQTNHKPEHPCSDFKTLQWLPIDWRDIVHNHFRGHWGLLRSGPYSLYNQCCNHIPSFFSLLQPHAPVSGTFPATFHLRGFAPSVPSSGMLFTAPLIWLIPFVLHISVHFLGKIFLTGSSYPYPLHSPASQIFSLQSASPSLYGESYILTVVSGFVSV